MTPEEHLHLTAGEEKTYTQSHETGMNITLHFCGHCGGTIYKTADSENFAGMAIIQAGTLDNPNLLKVTNPAMELYTKYRASWLPPLEGAIQNAEF